MIVCVIIGALAAMVVPRLSDIIRPNKNRIALGDLATIAQGIQRFEIDCERFPTNDEGLNVLLTKPSNAAGWAGPYFSSGLKDPWGNAYMYRTPGTGENNKDYDIWSMGADGKDGTADDVIRGKK
jgi:general secretion pathway protein G